MPIWRVSDKFNKRYLKKKKDNDLNFVLSLVFVYVVTSSLLLRTIDGRNLRCYHDVTLAIGAWKSRKLLFLVYTVLDDCVLVVYG